MHVMAAQACRPRQKNSRTLEPCAHARNLQEGEGDSTGTPACAAAGCMAAAGLRARSLAASNEHSEASGSAGACMGDDEDDGGR